MSHEHLHAEHDHHEGGHDEGEHGNRNKQIGLVISVLALCLAITELLGQSAQMRALQQNIEASNLWSFFQAKTIRETTIETAADELETALAGVKDAGQRAAMQERIAKWREKAARYESDPQTREGRKELEHRAKDAEGERDHAEKKHHRYELGSGCFQIAIVLASASIITGFMLLLQMAMGLGGLGLLFLLAGLIA